jgi:hypothetical protein
MDIIVKPAISRNISINMEEEEVMKGKMLIPCFYCGSSYDERLNGLDRIDSSKGYTDDNTVSCCSTCNCMKSSLPLNSFLYHVLKIYLYSCKNIVITNKSCCSNVFGGTQELKQTLKAKNMNLTTEERIKIWTSPCYLCGHNYALGIDRLDSTKPYDSDNVNPCCRFCNYIKKHWIEDEVKNHIVKIVKNMDIENQNIIVKELYDNVLGNKLENVGAFDEMDNLVMAFPTICSARSILGISKLEIGKKCIGYIWKHISFEDFSKFRNDKFYDIIYLINQRKKHL